MSERLAALKGGTKVLLRYVGPDDLDGLAALSAEVWSRPLAEERRAVEWSYHWNLQSRLPALVAVDAHDRLVGARALWPWPLVRGAMRRPISAVQFSGTVVHPDVRRRGLFRVLTEAALSLLDDRGFEVIFNVSVPASRAGYEKLGWRYQRGLRRYVMALPGLLPTRPASAGRVSTALELSQEDMSSTLEMAEALSLGTAATEWNHEFLRWRLSRPGTSYLSVSDEDGGRLLARVNSLRGVSTMTVGAFSSEIRSGRRLRPLVASLSRHTGARIATMLASTGNTDSRTLIGAGFIPNPRRPNLNLGVRWLDSVHGTEGQLDARRNWSLRTIDIDTF